MRDWLETTFPIDITRMKKDDYGEASQLKPCTEKSKQNNIDIIWSIMIMIKIKLFQAEWYRFKKKNCDAWNEFWTF